MQHTKLYEKNKGGVLLTPCKLLFALEISNKQQQTK